MLKKLKSILLLAVLVLSASTIFAQGVTTSSLKGTVVDDKGNPLDGVTVALVHVPSGTQYGTLTRADGRYNIQGIRIGGPYRIVATSIGFAKQEKNAYLFESK